MSNDLERAPEYRGNLAEEKLPQQVSLDQLKAESQKRWEQQGGTIPNVGDQGQSAQNAAIGITGVAKRPQDCQPSQAQPDGELPERQGYDQPPRSVANPGGPPRKAQP